MFLFLYPLVSSAIEFKELPLELQVIGLCESAGIQEARGPFGEVGILQIYPKYHQKKAESMGFDIYTTEGNLNYGLWLYAKEGVKPWRSSKKCWGGIVFELWKIQTLRV